jgi:hypothetical protein
LPCGAERLRPDTDADVGVGEVMPGKLRGPCDRTYVRVPDPRGRRKCPKRPLFSRPKDGVGSGVGTVGMSRCEGK